MKRIYYLAAITALGFSACQKEPVLHSVLPVPADSIKTIMTITQTLKSTDYAELPSSNYASKSFYFKNSTDAQNGIPQILTTEYPTASNGSTAAVTYSQLPATFAEADSVIKDDSYTLTNADYLLLPGNKYTDFTVAQLLQWLPYKFPGVPNGTLKLITWTIYPASTSPVMPYSFLFVNNKWQAIYTIQPAQYTVLGVGKYDEFTSSTTTNLPQTLGALVNADVTITDTIKTGDVIYVSYNYYVSSTADYQRIQPLEYNGNNFVLPYNFNVTINFKKTAGVWTYVQPLPVIAHTLTAADITLIANSGTATGASASVLSNLGSYGDFESAWTPAELDAAFILVLKADDTAPVTNTNYTITYNAYVSGGDVPMTYTFQWSGTAWVAQQ